MSLFIILAFSFMSFFTGTLKADFQAEVKFKETVVTNLLCRDNFVNNFINSSVFLTEDESNGHLGKQIFGNNSESDAFFEKENTGKKLLKKFKIKISKRSQSNQAKSETKPKIKRNILHKIIWFFDSLLDKMGHFSHVIIKITIDNFPKFKFMAREIMKVRL
jgi:hypothetical protein